MARRRANSGEPGLRPRGVAAVWRLLAAACLFVTLGLPAWGQCAMCREAAASQEAEGIKALNRGIILLAIPPIAILVGIGCVTYRYRDSYRGQAAETLPKQSPAPPRRGD